MRQSPKISRPSFAVKSLIEEKPAKQLKKGVETLELAWEGDENTNKKNNLRDEWGQQVAKALEKGKGAFSLSAEGKNWFDAGVALEMGSYRFAKQWKQEATTVQVYLPSNYSKKYWDRGRLLGQSVNLARHLTNIPANFLNPKTYAEFLENMFADRKGVSIEILNADDVRKAGCNLLYSVGKAAAEGSRLVRITYRPKSASQKRPVIFVGKGITFDSGGLDIKGSSGMRLMKKDMAGSATVAGIMNWLTEAEIPLYCEAYFALAENAIAGDAMRPGDIIQSKGGHLVEIHNTDAEGRLVLVDAISMAYENLRQEKIDRPAALFDFATLTGAMRVALGPKIAGFFANEDELAEKFSEAAAKANEPVWRMPLFEEYDSYLKSSCADFANASDSGFAGAISAALFLGKFIDPKTPWVHVDMFGWADKASGAYAEVGGNGQCVQLMAALLEAF